MNILLILIFFTFAAIGAIGLALAIGLIR